MRIELFGNKDLVSNAYVEQNSVGLEIIINTSEKWLDIQYISTSSVYSEKSTAPHICYSISGSDESECEVVFICDNDEEVALVSGPKYSNTEKDQFSSLIVNRSAVNPGEVLCFLDNKSSVDNTKSKIKF